MDAVITGIGIVSPYGIGRKVFWQGVLNGNQVLRPISRFDASQYRNNIAGEITDFDCEGEERATAFAMQASREALVDSGWKIPDHIGLVLGTNFCGAEAAENFIAGSTNSGLDKYLGEDTLKKVRKATGTSGPENILSLSCASGAAAIGIALEWLRSGKCEAVLAGGFDELSESAFAGLSALRAISKGTIKPWDINRDGTVFAEGAGILLIESEQSAATRDAEIYARLLGRGINNDAFHMTAPDKTGRGIAEVMRMALHDANVEPYMISHINLHGTGTKYNDLIETTAIESVFGTHAQDMIFTANKSLFGHAMGAAGALEAAVCALSIKNGVVPPTIGCKEADPELGISPVQDKAITVDIQYAMTNSYGLGGTNASLVLGR